VTDEYEAAIRALFEDQGFTVKEADEGLLARKDGTGLRLHPVQDPTAVTGLKTDPEHRTIAFVNDQPDTVPDGIDVSVFSLEQDDDSPEEPETMPSSYEVIGDIAILNLEDEQLDDADEIAAAIMEQQPNIRTVLQKTDPLSGEFRVGEYERIAGDGTETVHIEHGARFRVDPTEVYFSERLGHERERIMELVEDGERVAVWFAGVAPYAILIARHTDAAHIDSIEKNPAGHTYAEDNIELNGVRDHVTAHRGDVREIAPGLDRPDRIIMPLPGSADAFIELALERIEDGGTVHYYRFGEQDPETGEMDWASLEAEVAAAAESVDREVEVIHREVCGHYAPYIERVCLDLRVHDA